ncbi:MAG: hypothetical protein FOGNACKC_02488 [Anaerolineae bacterium]|nr:hypothetical protein [Anaerolineae bacterium]
MSISETIKTWGRMVQRQMSIVLPAEQRRFEQLCRRQMALAAIELTINQEHSLQRTLAHIAEVSTNLLPASGGASVILWDAKNDEFSVSATTVPGQQSHQAAQRVRRRGGATRWIIEHHQPVIVPDVRRDPFTANSMLPQYSLQAYVGMPLLAEGKVLGVLYALDRHTRKYTEADLDFLTALANRAALTVVKVRLYERVQAANEQFKRESEEKERLIAELQAALAKIKTLRGLIPICANCKKIRDDKGFWQQVEIYIEAHSNAEFSHGICPDCKKKLYPEFFSDEV